MHKDITKGKCQELGINWLTMSCTLCNEKFNSKESAIRHPSRNHQIYAQKRKAGSRGNYDCDICGKKISYKDSLRDHKIRFHNEGESTEKFKCSQCDFNSPLRRSFTWHMKIAHGGVTGKKSKKALKSLTCEVCEYSTPWKSKLLDHILEVHQKIKDQVCKLCDYATSRKSHLTLHVRSVHLKEKPFQCTTCGFTAAQPATLKAHVEFKHTKPPKRERKCFICNKLMSLVGSLKGHLKKQHSDKQCHKCDFKALDEFGLNDHYEQCHGS